MPYPRQDSSATHFKLFGVGSGKDSADFRGMRTEAWNNQVCTAFRKSDDSYPPIVGAFRPADQSFFKQAIDGHPDGAGSEMDLRPCRGWLFAGRWTANEMFRAQMRTSNSNKTR